MHASVDMRDAVMISAGGDDLLQAPFDSDLGGGTSGVGDDIVDVVQGTT